MRALRLLIAGLEDLMRLPPEVAAATRSSPAWTEVWISAGPGTNRGITVPPASGVAATQASPTEAPWLDLALVHVSSSSTTFLPLPSTISMATSTARAPSLRLPRGRRRRRGAAAASSPGVDETEG